MGRAESSVTGLDELMEIERVAGTRSPDTLIGDEAHNLLQGRGGADHIEGRDGNDSLGSEVGLGFLDGGNGTDSCFGGETVVNCEVIIPE